MDFQELANLIPRRIRQWSQNDVALWLKFIQLSHLISAFKKHNVQGILLFHLDQPLLEKLDIKSKIIAKKIKSWSKNGLPAFDKFIEKNEEIDIETDGSCEQFSILRSLKQKSHTIQHDMYSSIKQKTQISSILPPKLLTDRAMTADKKQKRQGKILRLYELNNKSNAFYEFSQKGGIIGKNANCDIFIIQNQIAPFHCQIVYKDSCYYLSSMEQYKIGTWKKIKVKSPLLKKVLIEMGNNIFEIKGEEKILKISLIEGQSKGQYFQFDPIQNKKIVIGRRVNCQICFPLDNTMSGLHAKITYENGLWYFQDMQTTNGSWMKLQGLEKVVDMLTFKLGNTTHTYECRLINKYTTLRRQETILTEAIGDKCYLCLTQQKNSYFVPCCHICCCLACGTKVAHCPVCSIEVSEAVKVYRV